MSPRRISTIIAAGLIAVSLGACSSGSGDTKPGNGDTNASQQDAAKQAKGSDKAKASDPCSLLTHEQAAEIVGAEVNDAEKGEFGGCTWKAAEDTLPPRMVVVTVLKDGAHERSRAESEGSESGVGDDAFWLGGILAVQAGSTELSVVATDKDLDVAKDKTLQAAKLVVANLG